MHYGVAKRILCFVQKLTRIFSTIVDFFESNENGKYFLPQCLAFEQLHLIKVKVRQGDKYLRQ